MPNIINEVVIKKGGVANIIEAPHIIPKVLTKQTGLANDIDFVGRKNELQKVDELLNQNSMLLLLNGIGGIGKSTLASYYLNQKKDNFDYYGFVQVNEDIKLSLAFAFSTSLDLKSEKIDNLFAEIMNKLQNLEGKKLLIIDDVKEMDNQLDEINTLMTLKNCGFQILFTSRESKEYILQYFLDIMSLKDARELFLKHYATVEMDKIDKILEYLDYHTLFIEMTAKTLTKRKRTLSLDKMIEKFSNGEFTSIEKNKNESFNQFLNDLFADDNVLQDEDTLLFLKRLSVLPSIEISFEDLYRFLVCEDEDKLELFFNELVDNGWLIESDGGYKLHQIIKEYLLANNSPTYPTLKNMLEYFTTRIDNNIDIQTAIDVREDLSYFDSIVMSMERLGIANETVANLYDGLGNIYRHLGQYSQALPLLERSLELRQNLLGENHSSIATSYNNLAEFYRLTGQYREALQFYEKNLNICQKVLGENHLETARNYNNLALLYQSIGELTKALLVHKKALKVKVKNLGEKHPLTASSYNNLAWLYRLMGEYSKALPLYKKFLKIFKDVLGENHPNTASSYSGLALLYQSMEEYTKALFLHEKALNIRQKHLGENHPNTATSYNHLVTFYYNQGDYPKAMEYMKKVLDIRVRVLPAHHPDLIDSKKRLEMIRTTL